MTDNFLSGRILVVEDEMIVAMLLEDLLTELGCEIIGPAANVEQALKMIETAGVLDAAVLDINLNGVESYSVADELAARNVPFVFSTSYGRKSLHKGYSRFPLLQKPFSLQELGDAINELLSSNEPAVSTE